MKFKKVLDELEKVQNKEIEVDKGSKIIDSGNFCIYKRGGQSMFISDTIKVGGGELIGLLNEEELGTGKIRKRVVELNFKKKVVSMENVQKMGVVGMDPKVVQFGNIVDVQINPDLNGSSLQFSVFTDDSILTF